MDKKKILWAVLSAVIAALTIFAVVSQNKDFSPEAFREFLRGANPYWMAAAFVSMTGFFIFEGLAIRVLVIGLDSSRKRCRGILYGAADVYFSAITPSASGGQPASAFFMIQDGIPAAVTAVILLVNLIMYTFAILFVGAVCMIGAREVLFRFSTLSKVLIAAGYLVLAFTAVVFLLLLLRERLLHRICAWAIGLVDRMRLIRHPEKIHAKLQHLMDEYDECSQMIARKRKMLFWAFFYNLMQRVSQLTVTACVYMASGGSLGRFFEVWSTHAFMALGSNCVPIPGAMGVADYLLIDGLNGIVDPLAATNLELVSRSISFYGCVILSLVIVIIGYLSVRLEKRREKHRPDAGE